MRDTTPALEDILSSPKVLASGDDVQVSLIAMTGLAMSMFGAGDLPGAQAIEERVFTECQALLGPNDHRTLNVASSLAATHLERGDVEGALPIWRQVLDAKRGSPAAYDDALAQISELANSIFHDGRKDE